MWYQSKLPWRYYLIVFDSDHLFGMQVKFPVQRGQTVGSAPQLKLVAPESIRDVFDVDDVKLPEWPEHMWVVIVLSVYITYARSLFLQLGYIGIREGS